MTLREFWLILHFVGIGLGFGVGLASVVVIFAAARIEPELRQRLPVLMKPVRWTAHAGLTMLVVSGVGLVWSRWPAILEHQLFFWKMVLVCALVLLVVYNTAIQMGAGLPPLPKPMLPLTAILGATIIVLAVLIFQ